MKKPIEDRAAALLRRGAAAALPVRTVHGELVAEGAPLRATYAELGMRLRQRTDLFLVFEAEHPLGPRQGWPAELCAEYEAALRDAGIDTDARVALAERGPPWPLPAADDESAAPVARIETSLVALWSGTSMDAETRTRIAEALREAEAIRDSLESVVD